MPSRTTNILAKPSVGPVHQTVRFVYRVIARVVKEEGRQCFQI